MARKSFQRQLEELFQNQQWDDARLMLEREREATPNSHWLLTQLGVTFYEQKRYEEAKELFLKSFEIVNDCPLTLWNLAGAFDSLGDYGNAIALYTWLLRSKKSAKDDPCWESQEWTDSLKTDCVYRLGACFQHSGRITEAEDCYRQYISLLTIGMNGTYPVEQAVDKIRALGSGRKTTRKRLKDVFESTLVKAGIDLDEANGTQPPKFTGPERRIGRRAASKR